LSVAATLAPAPPAIVLLAHGSRDALWKTPVERVAAIIGQLDPRALVRCAYLELTQPDLSGALSELQGAGARSVSVLPMFFGLGKHLREDLPALAARLRELHPELHITVAAPVFEDEAILELIARRALALP
jgi:sirohydrochlorin cobaltochelatase